ncbi:MAG: hypothetical protein P8R42_11990 [Candidatus Binatia bacterium]|nr:hypothetical protein [Candidatus Binatia bacterium]
MAGGPDDPRIVGLIRYCNQFDPPYQKDGAVDAIWEAKVKGSEATAPAVCPEPRPPLPYSSASAAFVTTTSSLRR